MSVHTAAIATAPAAPASWSAVGALTLCVSALIASEFLPVSLLTPLAADLHLTEGQAGQAIAVSGAFAVLTSLEPAFGALSGLVLLHERLALSQVAGVAAVIAAASGAAWSGSRPEPSTPPPAP